MQTSQWLENVRIGREMAAVYNQRIVMKKTLFCLSYSFLCHLPVHSQFNYTRTDFSISLSFALSPLLFAITQFTLELFFQSLSLSVPLSPSCSLCVSLSLVYDHYPCSLAASHYPIISHHCQADLYSKL